jgi:hypothetical protein
MTADYRARLIEAVQRSESQRFHEMTDAQLEAFIASGLGLPLGTTFTDEQLEMIAGYPKGSQL